MITLHGMQDRGKSVSCLASSVRLFVYVTHMKRLIKLAGLEFKSLG